MRVWVRVWVRVRVKGEGEDQGQTAHLGGLKGLYVYVYIYMHMPMPMLTSGVRKACETAACTANLVVSRSDCKVIEPEVILVRETSNSRSWLTCKAMHVHACVCIYMHACMCTHACMCMHVHVCSLEPTPRTDRVVLVCMHARMGMHMHVCPRHAADGPCPPCMSCTLRARDRHDSPPG